MFQISEKLLVDSPKGKGGGTDVEYFLFVCLIVLALDSQLFLPFYSSAQFTPRAASITQGHVTLELAGSN